MLESGNVQFDADGYWSVYSDNDIRLDTGASAHINLDSDTNSTTEDFVVKHDDTEDLFKIVENGTITAPQMSTAEITTAGNTALITKEYGDANYGAAADNLGNHTATQDLDINTFDITSTTTFGLVSDDNIEFYSENDGGVQGYFSFYDNTDLIFSFGDSDANDWSEFIYGKQGVFSGRQLLRGSAANFGGLTRWYNPDDNKVAQQFYQTHSDGDFILESYDGVNLLDVLRLDDTNLAWTAPETSNADITALGNKALITKEYGDANYGGGSGDVTKADDTDGYTETGSSGTLLTKIGLSPATAEIEVDVPNDKVTISAAGLDYFTTAAFGIGSFAGATNGIESPFFRLLDQTAGFEMNINLDNTLTADRAVTFPDTGGVFAFEATASGFDGNLATTDNTLQEIAQKVDDLVLGLGDITRVADTDGYNSSGTQAGDDLVIEIGDTAYGQELRLDNVNRTLTLMSESRGLKITDAGGFGFAEFNTANGLYVKDKLAIYNTTNTISGAIIPDLLTVNREYDLPDISGVLALEADATGFNGNLATTDNTLQEIAQKVDDLVISGTDDQIAAEVPNTPSGNLVATDVQAALNELQTEVDGNTTKTSNATHTGDVTGSTALTIATDAVDLPMLSATGTASSSTYLRGDNTWASIAGGGDVSKVGTPVNNQVGVWTGDGTLEGDADLTFNGVDLTTTGDIELDNTLAASGTDLNFLINDTDEALRLTSGNDGWSDNVAVTYALFGGANDANSVYAGKFGQTHGRVLQMAKKYQISDALSYGAVPPPVDLFEILDNTTVTFSVTDVGEATATNFTDSNGTTSTTGTVLDLSDNITGKIYNEAT
ncbi:MAG: hypothetical protein KUG81_06345, partial [Gammaproteobacteria bacterium]|nr:hypothetical protein [Gammaproteobacteria bacterium]